VQGKPSVVYDIFQFIPLHVGSSHLGGAYVTRRFTPKFPVTDGGRVQNCTVLSDLYNACGEPRSRRRYRTP
jgi:hypothetical protein